MQTCIGGRAWAFLAMAQNTIPYMVPCAAALTLARWREMAVACGCWAWRVGLACLASLRFKALTALSSGRLRGAAGDGGAAEGCACARWRSC